MGMSATQLGREFFSRSARDMNTVLRDHGFLQGGPGAWSPTELGKQFAQWVDKDNGHGGFAYRAWEWLSWDDGIVDALKASMAANPDGVVAAAAAPAAAVAEVTLGSATSHASSGARGQLFSKNRWVAVAVLGTLAVAPTAGRAWQEKVRPAASKVRARIAERRSARSLANKVEHAAEE